MAIPLALSRRRDYAGPVLFSYGFRPFFLGAGIWSASAILLWVRAYFGEIALPVAMGPLDWHMHEMIFGYAAAVIAGFLLTAIPNWTGRLPVNGWPLASLVALWLAGRVAIYFAVVIGPLVAAAIDISFLVVLAATALREIVSGKNWNNLRVLVILLALVAANVVWHLEILWRGAGTYGPRMALGAVIVLITLIGGRIIPSFTRNWLTRKNPGRLPQPLSRFDMLAVAAGVVSLVAWIAFPASVPAGVLLLLAGGLHAVRLARWAGDRTVTDRLVLVLHVAYAFVPAGFLLLGSAILWPLAIAPSAGIHAWSTGAIGLMTLAVMTRASLGHTGRPLAASYATQLVYALVLIAALVRIAAASLGANDLLHVAAIAWVAGFAGFVLAYGPLLLMKQPAWTA